MHDGPHERRERRARDMIAAAGLHLEQRGRAWRIRGPGVDMLIGSLADVERRDLVPYLPRQVTDG